MPWTDSARLQYARTATRYTTDLTDAEFALIAPHLPAPSRLGRPRKVDLREVLNAILFLLRTSCPWDLLPKELPAKSTVFGYFRRWWEDGTWQILHAKLVVAREQAGREASPTAGIVDSQSVRTTEAGGPRGGACPPARAAGPGGRRQEDQRPQAPHPGRHAGPLAGGRDPHRQHPGSRWAGAGLPPAAPALSLAPPDLRRWRLPRGDRSPCRSTGASAAPDRQARARHPRLCRPAQALAGREDLRLARPQPKVGQGFRGNPRLGRNHGPPRLDPAPRPTPCKILRSAGAFADGHLEAIVTIREPGGLQPGRDRRPGAGTG